MMGDNRDNGPPKKKRKIVQSVDLKTIPRKQLLWSFLSITNRVHGFISNVYDIHDNGFGYQPIKRLKQTINDKEAMELAMDLSNTISDHLFKDEISHCTIYDVKRITKLILGRPCKGGKAGLVNELVEYYKTGTMPSDRRVVEKKYLKEIGQTRHHGFDLNGILVPDEVMAQIFAYFGYTGIINTVGTVSWNWFELCLYTYPSCVVTVDNISSIPIIVWKSIHRLKWIVDKYDGTRVSRLQTCVIAQMDKVCKYIFANKIRELELKVINVYSFKKLLPRFFETKRSNVVLRKLSFLSIPKGDMRVIKTWWNCKLSDQFPNLEIVEYPICLEWCIGLTRLRKLIVGSNRHYWIEDDLQNRESYWYCHNLFILTSLPITSLIIDQSINRHVVKDKDPYLVDTMLRNTCNPNSMYNDRFHNCVLNPSKYNIGRTNAITDLKIMFASLLPRLEEFGVLGNMQLFSWIMNCGSNMKLKRLTFDMNNKGICYTRYQLDMFNRTCDCQVHLAKLETLNITSTSNIETNWMTQHLDTLNDVRLLGQPFKNLSNNHFTLKKMERIITNAHRMKRLWIKCSHVADYYYTMGRSPLIYGFCYNCIKRKNYYGIRLDNHAKRITLCVSFYDTSNYYGGNDKYIEFLDYILLSVRKGNPCCLKMIMNEIDTPMKPNETDIEHFDKFYLYVTKRLNKDNFVRVSGDNIMINDNVITYDCVCKK